jgi:hypothetical protein
MGSSDDSVATYYKCYIPPDINESNAESVAREEEIQKRIITRKQKSLPDRLRSPPTQRQRVRDTLHTTNIVSFPPHATSMTIDRGEDMDNTPNEQVSGASPTVPAKHCVEGNSLQSGKEGVDLSSSMSLDGNLELSECHNNQEKIIQQLVQTLTLDDLNPHGIYSNPDKPLPPKEITVLYDSGASITMLPGGFTDSWRNLRPNLMSLSGTFAEEETQTNIQIGEFHAQMTLDSGETIRFVIPEAVCLSNNSTTYLLCDTQFLLAGHSYISDLRKPQIQMAQGGTYTMDVIAAHKIIKLLPISAHQTTNYRTVIIHLPTPYEPPTFYNDVTLRRPDITTPPAIVWHARLACACKEVMMRTQKNVTGMRIQNDSWKLLDTLLPCSSCVAGKMRKSNAARAATYSDMKTLTTNLIASQNPA